ncbi:MAG: cobalamin biosynthesis protein [Cumulibacter sp.]
MRTLDAVSIGLLVGFAADRLFGDPQRGHPVAGFGRVAAALQRPLYRDSKVHGAAYEAILVGGVSLLGVVVYRGPVWLRAGVTTAATWAVLGGRTLEREARAVAGSVQGDDLSTARHRVRSLVGRDPSNLSGDDLARACVESLAENASDAVVAPLVWGAAAGVPGLLGYRAINTLDAMVGYRSPRWARFGWAAARVDDAANFVPARLAAGLTALLSGRAREVLAVVRRDARQHPSPNGGRIEAAYAATLGVRLGGSNTYGGVTEDRGVLGNGAPVRVADVDRAARLSRRLSAASLAVCVLSRIVVRRFARR